MVHCFQWKHSSLQSIGSSRCVSCLLQQSQEGSRLHVGQLDLCGSRGHPTIEHGIEDGAAHGQHKPKTTKQTQKLMLNQVHLQRNPSQLLVPRGSPGRGAAHRSGALQEKGERFSFI